jgi:hypothetical protein
LSPNPCGTFSRHFRRRGRAEIIADLVFPRLGFTDTAITTVALSGADEDNLHVLTDDVHLYNELAYRGVNVINFNHLRSSRMID